MITKPENASPLQGMKILPFLPGSIAIEKAVPVFEELLARGAIINDIVVSPAGEKILELTQAQRNTIKRRPVPEATGHLTIRDEILQILPNVRILTETSLWHPESQIEHIELTRNNDIPFVLGLSADLASLLANPDEDDFDWEKIIRDPDLTDLAEDHNLLNLLKKTSGKTMLLTTLLASNKDIAAAPAMNWKMWENPGTQKNMDELRARGFHIIGPVVGDMACQEYGMGRLADVPFIVNELEKFALAQTDKPLLGQHVLVTAGPTQEPFGTVRTISNRSSGRQGYAIARALAELGAKVTIVSGPVDSAVRSRYRHKNIEIIPVEETEEMYRACLKTLEDHPDTIMGIFAAAVADFRPVGIIYPDAPDIVLPLTGKGKKRDDGLDPLIKTERTRDILQTIAKSGKLPFTIGFAAETPGDGETLLTLARKKRERKGCTWMIANDVSGGKVMGQDTNAVLILCENNVRQEFSETSKETIAAEIARLAARHIKENFPETFEKNPLEYAP